MKKYEEFQDPLNVKEFIITYNNIEEAMIIANVLHSNGYHIFDFESVQNDVPNWDCFLPGNDHKRYDFCLARHECFSNNRYESIDFLEFSNRSGFKKLRKIKNTKEDPFDEKNWGYVQESLSIEIFQVGDKVRVNELGILNMHRNSGMNIEKYTKARSNGIIILIGQGEIIQVRWENGELSLYRSLEYIDKLDNNKNRTKIKNTKEDPFDEENWGYVQEMADFNFLKVGDRVLADKLMNNAYANKGNGEGVVIEKDRNGNYFMIRWDNGYVGRYSDQYISFIDTDKREKIKKPDIDPFEEENWGRTEE